MGHFFHWRGVPDGVQIYGPFLIFNTNIHTKDISPHLLDRSSNSGVALAGVVHQGDIQRVEVINGQPFLVQVGLQSLQSRIGEVDRAIPAPLALAHGEPAAGWIEVFEEQILDLCQPHSALPEQVEGSPVEQGVTSPGGGLSPGHALLEIVA